MAEEVFVVSVGPALNYHVRDTKFFLNLFFVLFFFFLTKHLLYTLSALSKDF